MTLKLENISEIKEFVENYINQDNRCTAWPYAYVVQKRVERAAYNDEGQVAYFDHQYAENIKSEDLEDYLRDWYQITDGEVPEHIQKYYFTYEWEDVQWFFKEDGAQDYLDNDAHNLGKTRFYVKHFRRNSEAEFILRALFTIAGYDYDKESR